MSIDPYILGFSAITVVVTIWMGFRSAKTSKTASDFFVAGRSVSVGWNASAISGEYLSAASFMGVAGMVMSSGYDALWYPVCYACGYLFLLLFIAGPLRRFGAYTIPDFAEGRFDSPLFRKIAVVFVLFIGFFYTMPQMKGAGTTLAYIFPGLPYWAGVVLVGAVITLNVALGGMKGITLVQAFQYWAKMFAISVPIFMLMAVYGHYGKQIEVNGTQQKQIPPGIPSAGMRELLNSAPSTNLFTLHTPRNGFKPVPDWKLQAFSILGGKLFNKLGISMHSEAVGMGARRFPEQTLELHGLVSQYGNVKGKESVVAATTQHLRKSVPWPTESGVYGLAATRLYARVLEENGIILLSESSNKVTFAQTNILVGKSRNLPEKAPADTAWLSPFGPLTTKAAKAAKRKVSAPPSFDLTNQVNRLAMTWKPSSSEEGIRQWARLVQEKWSHPAVGGKQTLAADVVRDYVQTVVVADLRQWRKDFQIVWSNEIEQRIIRVPPLASSPPSDFASALKSVLETNGITVISAPGNVFKAFPTKDAVLTEIDPRPYSLLYTYSLIIALVCGTAGLPHILVRFYTNPDGVAAKRTTMWVMILIGVFYVFPPVFGVMGRNLLPELYSGIGAKGTDKVVLELPRILNEKKLGKWESEKVGSASQGSLPPAHSPTFPPAATSPTRPSGGIPWGSILSGITCAGAFAAFMSTFSGLLVSMTGALAHDVYGRMLRPKSTPEQRMRMFRIGAVLLGGGAIIAGSFVEPLQINFMVGQAFAIAAASYFPLLFMSAWWRGMTMKGAAAGMLTGGLLALTGISLTSFSDLGWLKLADFWAANPLLRILCEQPAIWTVPLAITLMVVVSKLTAKEVPSDIRMKMLVLHAPEKLGLKQEYIQEHQQGH
jgi:Na+(H+)/acetate symporter ActP